MPEGLIVQLGAAGPLPLDVDFAVKPGQTLALVGPSGAGKSTVLRAIAGLDAASTGAIRCGGEIWLDSAAGIAVPTRSRRVGLVFQSYALFPHLSARTNLLLAMPPTTSDRLRATEDLLERVQLAGLGDRLPHQLSGGQQQRVALARALARDPLALLLDEPLSAVDHPTRRALLRLLADLRRDLDIPVIIVTHDVADVVECADTICFLQDGQQREFGATRHVLARPNGHLRAWLTS